MNLSEKELEEQLKEIGSELLKPPSSTDALLKGLDKAECLLTNVEQSPTRSMRDTLLPLMKALISDKLLKHSEEDVKVTATACITEITRITAPDAPYDDDKMKVIFQLTLEAFRKLSNVSGRCYMKALSILDAVAKVRLCLVMLDLECDNLILEMFQSFLKLIRSNHPTAVFSAMEAIMTNVLDESEEVSSDLLRPILASVRKENQEATSISWKLAERVMSNCATKLQPYLMDAVQSLGASLDDYAPVVMSICRNETDNIDDGKHLVTQMHTPDASIEENPRTDAASESLISGSTVAAGNDNILKGSSKKSQKCSEQSKIAETKIPDNVESKKAEDTLDTVPKKRGRKPNSLMNPDEGYEHYWIGKGRERSRLSNQNKSNDQETKFSPVSLRIEKVSLPTKVEKVSSGHAAEKHIQSKVEGVNENMTKKEENTRVRSRKPKVGKSRKDKTTAVSPVSPRVESLPTEEEKESPGHAEEKHIQSEDELVNENMKKMEEKARVRSRKSKIGMSRKDEGTKFSSVNSKVKKASLSAEVGKESSAHTEEKRIQVEDEVVNENTEMVKKAQARSRRSTVGKSRKDKATKFSSISPKVQRDTLTTEEESSADAEEKPLQSEDEVVNEHVKMMEEKTQSRAKKSKTGKCKDKAIHDPRCVISEEKVSVPSDYKEKLSVHLVMKLRVKSTFDSTSMADRNSNFTTSPHSIDLRSGFCPQTKIFHSLRPPLSLPPLSHPLSVIQHAFSLLQSSPPPPNSTLLIDFNSGLHLSYTVFLRQIRNLASNLKSLTSLCNGQVAFILAPTSLQIPVLYFALLSLGVVLSPANPTSSVSEISHQIQLSKPVIAFATSSTASKLPKLRFGTVLIDSPHFHSMLTETNGSDGIPNIKIDQSDSAAILYSSGTTGRVKGVLLSHRNLIAVNAGPNSLQLEIQEGEMEPHPVVLCPLPLFHIFGFVMLVRAVSRGDTLVLMERFEFEGMLRAVEKYRVKYIPVSPPLVVAMAKSELVGKYDLSSLQMLGCGGAPLGKEVIDKFHQKLPGVEIVQGYGLTESTAGASRTMDPEEISNTKSVGRLSGNMEAKIVDPASGDALLPNHKGELWLRGPTIMKGYVGDDKATTETLDPDGWLKTGDLCYFDSDGFLYIVDRLKELIKYKAYQVPPAELEHLLQSNPEIIDAAVIPYPDEEAGEIPMAYVVRKPGSNMSEAQVIDFIAKQVAPYKKIRRVSFIDAIPKSPAGKILRRELAKHALSHGSSKL